MDTPIVFISYSHDSDEHRARVLALSERLRKDGIETRLDQYLNGAPSEGWPRWMLNQLDEASFVLVVCTETYYRRFRGKEVPGKGKGVDWEGALITQELYDARRATLKFVPVLFDADHEPHIPEPLRGLNHYQPLSKRGYEALYDFLLDQAGVEPGEVGELKRKPRAKGQPLTFDNASDQPSAISNLQSAIVKVSLPPPLTPYLFGRDDELQLLDEAWANPSTNIVVFHALGGAGKSALVSKWLARLAAKNYDGARRVFGWSFFSQGSSENRSDSSEAFIDSALEFFGVTVEGDYFRKADRLAETLRAERTVLVLDGVEPMQYPPNTAGLPEGGLKDRALQTILLQLAAQQPGLCIITSRERLSDLNGYDQATVIQRPLDPLPYQTATGEQPCAQLLRALDVTGDDAEMLQAAQEFQGHAYGLTLLGSYVAEVLGGDLRRRKDIANLFDDDRFGASAERMIAAYETWLGAGVEVAILRLLGLFDRPAEAASISALREAPALLGLTETLQGLSEVKWQQALSKLRRLNLLSSANPHAPGELDAHPLVREHFRQQLKTHAPDAWRAGNLRLYEHLTRTAKEFPDTLEEMQPLYASVAHGCAARLFRQALEDVFYRRIRRNERAFSWKELGLVAADLSALSNFFDVLWDVPSSNWHPQTQGALLNEAGFLLHSLGRTKDAIAPLQQSLDLTASVGNWEGAASTLGNLYELYKAIGSLEKALTTAQEGVVFAEKSPKKFSAILAYTCLADAFHQIGQISEAKFYMRRAEKLQKRDQPQKPYLYSFNGVRYRELLFTLGKFYEASRNATLSLTISKKTNVQLDIALDYLSLGKIECRKEGNNNLEVALFYLSEAVNTLKKSCIVDHLPTGYIARAALFRQRKDFNHSKTDLIEAFQIAERGEMRLHLTDYHLESARLALAEGHKDTAREHYDKARQLIAETGYHRRDGELKELAEQLG